MCSTSISTLVAFAGLTQVHHHLSCTSGPKLDAPFQVWPNEHGGKGKYHFPQSAGYDTTQYALSWIQVDTNFSRHPWHNPLPVPWTLSSLNPVSRFRCLPDWGSECIEYLSFICIHCHYITLPTQRQACILLVYSFTANVASNRSASCCPWYT